MLSLGARLRAPGYLLVLLLSTGCVSAPQSRELEAFFPHDIPMAVQLPQVPFFPQEQYQCGPAALATVLQYTQVSIMPEQLVARVYIPALQGALQPEMLAATREYGRIPYLVSGTLEAVLRELTAGNPVLVLQNQGLRRWPKWHYAVVVGYDAARQQLTLRSGTIKDYQLSFSVFERTWMRAEHWAFLALMPGQVPATGEPERYFEAIAEFELLHPDSAGPAWLQGRQRWPGHPLISMGLSNWYYQAGEREHAIAELKRLLAVLPDYQPAQHNLDFLQNELVR
jgi:hypothetical protein